MLSKSKSQSVKINLKLLSIVKFSGDVVKVKIKVKIHMKMTFNFQAMQSTWHPECFCCEMCHKVINGIFFIKVPAMTNNFFSGVGGPGFHKEPGSGSVP